MPDLKLEKLPDRTPIKITITASPDLSRALTDYAEIYRSVYGQREKVEELIPFMLEKFLDSDSSFKRARKELLGRTDGAASATRG